MAAKSINDAIAETFDIIGRAETAAGVYDAMKEHGLAPKIPGLGPRLVEERLDKGSTAEGGELYERLDGFRPYRYRPVSAEEPEALDIDLIRGIDSRIRMMFVTDPTGDRYDAVIDGAELKEDDLLVHQKPAEFTKQFVVEPILDRAGGRYYREASAIGRNVLNLGYMDYLYTSNGGKAAVYVSPMGQSKLRENASRSSVSPDLQLRKLFENFEDGDIGTVIETDGLDWIVYRASDKGLKHLVTYRLGGLFDRGGGDGLVLEELLGFLRTMGEERVEVLPIQRRGEESEVLSQGARILSLTMNEGEQSSIRIQRINGSLEMTVTYGTS